MCGTSPRRCGLVQYREAADIAATGLTMLVVCVLTDVNACDSKS